NLGFSYTEFLNRSIEFTPRRSLTERILSKLKKSARSNSTRSELAISSTFDNELYFHSVKEYLNPQSSLVLPKLESKSIQAALEKIYLDAYQKQNKSYIQMNQIINL